MQKEGRLPTGTQHLQIRCLNHVVEASHGKLKRVVKPTLGFQPMKTAYATLKGLKAMRAPKTGQGPLFRYLPGVAGQVSLVHCAFDLTWIGHKPAA